MTVVLVAAALIAGTGAIAAIAPIDARLGLVGLTASLVAAGLIGDPLPSPAVLGIRLSAALLAVIMLRAASRSVAGRDLETGRGWSRHERSSSLGWPAEILIGVAGSVAGLAIAHGLALQAIPGVNPLPAPGLGDLSSAPALALSAAGLMLAIALGPVLFERVGLRRAIAAVLVTESVLVGRVAMAPDATVLAEVGAGLLLVAVAAGTGVLAAANASGPGPIRRP
jgi:hypothetical protein